MLQKIYRLSAIFNNPRIQALSRTTRYKWWRGYISQSEVMRSGLSYAILSHWTLGENHVHFKMAFRLCRLRGISKRLQDVFKVTKVLQCVRFLFYVHKILTEKVSMKTKMGLLYRTYQRHAFSRIRDSVIQWSYAAKTNSKSWKFLCALIFAKQCVFIFPMHVHLFRKLRLRWSLLKFKSTMILSLVYLFMTIYMTV